MKTNTSLTVLPIWEFKNMYVVKVVCCPKQSCKLPVLVINKVYNIYLTEENTSK
jgi:hypothetical protein